MLTLLVTAIMIVFFYAEFGEKYKKFSTTKKIISYTIFAIGIITFVCYIAIYDISMRSVYKAILGAFVVTFPILLVARLTQNQHHNKEKEREQVCCTTNPPKN